MSFWSTIGDIGKSLLGPIGGLLGNKQSNDSSKEVARENREFSLDMWNRNNEYNTPLAQMQRLKDAGLNPNLMYGQGTTGNSSAPASAEGRKPTQYSYMEGLQFWQNMKMNDQARQLQKSQTELNHAQAAKIEADTANTHAQMQNTLDTNQFNRESRPKILEKYDLDNAGIKLSNENLNKINAKIEADINQIKANTQLTARQADVAKASLGKIAIEVENAVKQGRSIDLQQVEQQFKNDLWKKGINPSSTGINGLIDWLRNIVLDKFKDAWKFYPKIPR